MQGFAAIDEVSLDSPMLARGEGTFLAYQPLADGLADSSAIP
jgi:hypothetical protein